MLIWVILTTVFLNNKSNYVNVRHEPCMLLSNHSLSCFDYQQISYFTESMMDVNRHTVCTLESGEVKKKGWFFMLLCEYRTLFIFIPRYELLFLQVCLCTYQRYFKACALVGLIRGFAGKAYSASGLISYHQIMWGARFSGARMQNTLTTPEDTCQNIRHTCRPITCLT